DQLAADPDPRALECRGRDLALPLPRPPAGNRVAPSMSLAQTAFAVLRFAAFEAAVFAAAARLARRLGGPFWLVALALDVAIEASLGQALSFLHLNSA